MNDPKVIANLLLEIAGEDHAKKTQHDVILIEAAKLLTNPIPLLLECPKCHERHIDAGEFADKRAHHTHACQHCGHVWRPAIPNTAGVQFLPGFKNKTYAIAVRGYDTEDVMAESQRATWREAADEAIRLGFATWSKRDPGELEWQLRGYRIKEV